MLFTSSQCEAIAPSVGWARLEWCKWFCTWVRDQRRPSNITRWALGSLVTLILLHQFTREHGKKTTLWFFNMIQLPVSLSLSLSLSAMLLPSLSLSLSLPICVCSWVCVCLCVYEQCRNHISLTNRTISRCYPCLHVYNPSSLWQLLFA